MKMSRFLKPTASAFVNLRRLLCSPSTASVTYEEFEAHRRQGTLIVDVREPKELDQIGEIPGAVNIPLGFLEQAFAMDTAEFKAIVGCTKPQQEDQIIFSCMKGIRAKTAKDLVEAKYGFKNSIYYPGSYTEWITKQEQKLT